MTPLARRLLVYAVCGVVLTAFAPVLSFVHLAAGAVILVGLALIDLIQSTRRRR